MELKQLLLLARGCGAVSAKEVNEVRSEIKTWKPENCPCKLCKIYLQRIVYLEGLYRR